MENGLSRLSALKGSLAAKVVAVILFITMCALMVACTFGLSILVNDGAFERIYTSNFYESELCYLVARDGFRQMRWDVATGPDWLRSRVDDTDWEFNAENTNILFVVRYYRTDDSGNQARSPYATVQNCDGEGVGGSLYFVGSSYSGSGGRYNEDIFEMDMYIRAPLLDNGEGFVSAYSWFLFLNNHKLDVIIWLVVALIFAVVLLVVLLRSAGHKKGVEGIYLNWFGKIPLEILATLEILAFAASIFIISEIGYYIEYMWLQVTVITLCTAVCILLVLSFLMNFAARVKAKKWWRNTLVYIILWRGLRCVWRRIKNLAVRFFRMLPFAWRSVIVFILALIIEIVLVLSLFNYALQGFVAILMIVFNLALVVGIVFIAGQLRTLQEGGRELARGNLSYKVDTRKMFWDFKKHGENLNSISEGMEKAVMERMKSEQFKTELITNVSHDIKTPLTSIINYVDLLKKEDMQSANTAEYIEVLDRQSARLKKLTEDLVEASKASSGVLSMEMSRNDICELLLQAKGEYEERFEKAGVTLIGGNSGRPLYVNCDGRHMWRVFDNIFSNICKYAQPGTRAFIDVGTDGGDVMLVFKNTSREILNISADELMERFIRGDRSRTTEGSGLGLSIARSLVELQGGTFTLALDGDLFKVIITMPLQDRNVQ